MKPSDLVAVLIGWWCTQELLSVIGVEQVSPLEILGHRRLPLVGMKDLRNFEYTLGHIAVL
jgi:hypothetical protein